MTPQRGASLRQFSYYKTGGVCDALYLPSSVEELAQARRAIADAGMPFFLLGAGTNSLVTDEPWPGAVIAFHKMSSMTVENDEIHALAGVDNSAVARKCLDLGWAGGEWMFRLPGQVGATVRMNARCYGGEISQVVTKTWSVTRDGQVKTYDGKTPFRGYKDTVFMTNSEIVAAVTMRFHPGQSEEISKKMAHCEQDRIKKGHFLFPSCGCVFKNDYSVGVPSGMMLDAAGVKGMRRGGAVVSDLHANFVFNDREATASDILQVTLMMRDAVWAKFGVWLQYEMEILGQVGPMERSRFSEARANAPKEDALAPLRAKFNRPKEQMGWG